MPASRKANSKDVNRSRCFPTPLVKNIRLGTMSLPNAVYLPLENEIENAQFNTMLCKGKMNFRGGAVNGTVSSISQGKRKWREIANAVPATCPVRVGGGPRAKSHYSTIRQGVPSKKSVWS